LPRSCYSTVVRVASSYVALRLGLSLDLGSQE
jgi:hypothetical protein